jgi:hypothetical protein
VINFAKDNNKIVNKNKQDYERLNDTVSNKNDIIVNISNLEITNNSVYGTNFQNDTLFKDNKTAQTAVSMFDPNIVRYDKIKHVNMSSSVNSLKEKKNCWEFIKKNRKYIFYCSVIIIFVLIFIAAIVELK